MVSRSSFGEDDVLEGKRMQPKGNLAVQPEFFSYHAEKAVKL